MQTQNTTSNVSVHVKVAYENEFRRFLLTPLSYDSLESTLKTLFNLDGEVRIKFQDDENDWVLLTTDQELVYATELSGKPLRLKVTLPETSQFKAVRGGKGCRGRGGFGRGGCKSPEERLTLKSSRLAERIKTIETKLSSNKLTNDREQFLRRRLAMLQEKLAEIQKQPESQPEPVVETPAATVAEPEPVATEECALGPSEDEKPSWRGRRGGRGRGGCRRAMMDEDGSDQPVKGRKARIAPEVLANFRQCKADLRAARESGDAEKIESCLEALKNAKAAKFEAREALRAQAL